MHFRVIDQGAYGAGSQAGVAVATDAATYESLWTQIAGRPGPSKVDFAKESAIFLSVGTRPTGGYGVEPLEISSDGDTVVIKTRMKAPPPGGIVTMALTAPYAVVAVDRPHVTRVRWLDEGGNVIAEVK